MINRIDAEINAFSMLSINHYEKEQNLQIIDENNNNTHTNTHFLIHFQKVSTKCRPKPILSVRTKRKFFATEFDIVFGLSFTKQRNR